MIDDTGISFQQILALALVQGVTEFLPISSSAHLILVPALLGWPDQGLLLDVAMHIGTLLAVMVYFRRDLGELITGMLDVLGNRRTQRARFTLQVIVATLPVMVAGFLLKDHIETEWRSPELIMITTIAFAILLWVADRRARGAEHVLADLSWRDAIIIGLAQAVALVPGVSRSGITMTAALLLGKNRPEAARFSLLLSIPTTAAAGALGALDLVGSDNAALHHDALIAGGLAFLSALLAVAGLMAWLRKATFTPFVVYRLLLGLLLGSLLLQGSI